MFSFLLLSSLAGQVPDLGKVAMPEAPRIRLERRGLPSLLEEELFSLSQFLLSLSCHRRRQNPAS
jgi:hypothetical protein